jgi:hypothetical protein
MNSPRRGIGYNAFIFSLPTPSLTITMEFVFVLGGVQIGFPKEKPIVDCDE